MCNRIVDWMDRDTLYAGPQLRFRQNRNTKPGRNQPQNSWELVRLLDYPGMKEMPGAKAQNLIIQTWRPPARKHNERCAFQRRQILYVVNGFVMHGLGQHESVFEYRLGPEYFLHWEPDKSDIYRSSAERFQLLDGRHVAHFDLHFGMESSESGNYERHQRHGRESEPDGQTSQLSSRGTLSTFECEVRLPHNKSCFLHKQLANRRKLCPVPPAIE